MKKNFLKVISFILMFSMCIANVTYVVSADEENVVIKKSVPADGAEDVRLIDTTLDLTFNIEIDKKTVSTKYFSIDPEARINYAGLVNPKTIRLYITRLAPSTTYTVTATKGVKTVNGTPVPMLTTSFTTTAEIPRYRQLSGGDFEDEMLRSLFYDAGANVMSYVKEDTNTVFKLPITWKDAPIVAPVIVEPGKTYCFRAKLKSSVNQQQVTLVIDIKGRPSLWKICGTIPENEWTVKEGEITIPRDVTKNNANFKLGFGSNGSTVWVDDIQFYEKGYDVPAPPLSFEGDSEIKEKTVIEEPEEDKIRQKLYGLGIYQKKEYSNEDSFVTREKFSEYMAKLVGLGAVMSLENYERFTDITEDYEGYIVTMANSDVMQADENGALRPEEIITLEEAARGIVVALGHKLSLSEKSPVDALLSLGFKLPKGLAKKSKIRYCDMNLILNEFIESECLYQELDEFKKGNVLEDKLGLIENQGIVEATEETSLFAPDGISEGEVQINGKIYTVLNTDVSDLIGKKVKFYTKTNSDDTIVYFCDIQKFNDVIKIDSFDIKNYEDNEYEYTIKDKDKIQKALVEKDKYVIYNNRSIGRYTTEDLIPYYGSVELIDNDNNGKYDIVKIMNYQNIVVDSIDKNNMIIRGKNSVLQIKNEDKTYVFFNGKPSKFDMIACDDILTVAQSKDKEMTVIYKTDKKIEGVVGKVNNKENIRTVVFYDSVHGEQIKNEMEVAKDFLGADEIRVNDYGVFYLDAFDRVVYLKKDGGQWQFGYIIRAYIDDADNDTLCIKLYNDDNLFEVLKCNDKVNIDGTTYKNYEEMLRIIKNGKESAQEQLIMYKLSDNKIRAIRTENYGRNNDFRVVAQGEAKFDKSTNTLGSVIAVDSNATVMVVPDDIDDYDMYEIQDANWLLTYYKLTDGTFKAYSASEKNLSADIVVVKHSGTLDRDGHSSGIVLEINNDLDEDDEVVTKIVSGSRSGKRNLKITDKIDLENVEGEDGKKYKLEAGDIIRFNMGRGGKVAELKIICKNTADYLNDKNPSYINGNKENNYTFFGKISEKEGTLVKAMDENGNTQLFDTNKFDSIYKYSQKSGKITTMQPEEIAEGMQTIVVYTWKVPMLLTVYE